MMQLTNRATLKMSPFLALLLAASCGDQVGPEQLSEAPIASMAIVSGEAQSALAGTELANPLVVRVTDPDGRPVSNQIVNFKVTRGGGSVFAGVALTDEQGSAQERWTLGNKAGEEQTVEARAVQASTGAKQVFAIFQATALTAEGVPNSVVVAPRTATLAEGETLQFSVTAESTSGSKIAASSTRWSSSDTAVATVNSSGQVRALHAGKATITALLAGETGNATVTVEASQEPAPDEPPPPPPGGGSGALNSECATPQSGWIFCDDFEQDRLARYFEYDDRDGTFTRASGVGVNGTSAMQARFAAGQVNAGSLKLAFGRTPDSYMRAADAGTANHREIYWRVYLRNSEGWTGGGGDKLSRAVVFAASNWSEAAIGHVWSSGSGNNYLAVDPASGTDASGNLRTTKYNDFNNLRWLGKTNGGTPLFETSRTGEWYCVESRMRLNDAGQSNGVLEFWINGDLEARAANLNWLGSFNAYGINALFLENYWGDGSPRAQERYIDNLVVSTQPVGCGNTPAPPAEDPPTEPTPPVVATVVVTPASTTLEVGAARTMVAAARDADNNAISGKTYSWASSNTNIATVTSGGRVTARAVGRATITASVDGKSGSATVTVAAPAVTSVSVSPTSASLAVGETQALTAAARNAVGTILGAVFTWSSSATPIATVSSSGVVTARAAGRATITASILGISATSTITVTAPEPEPEPDPDPPPPPPSGGVAPNILEDFSTYRSTADLIANPRQIYNTVEDFATNRIVLDTSVGVAAGGQSMRYDWGGGTGTIGRRIHVPDSREIWIEFTHRFEQGYSTEWGGGGDAAYKFLHVSIDATSTGGGRFGHGFRFGDDGRSNIEPPSDAYSAGFAETNFSLDEVADGQWHTYRYHIRLGDTDLHEFWLDGQLRARSTGFNTRASEIHGVALGRNHNQAPTGSQSQWWGQIKVWLDGNNPGW